MVSDSVAAICSNCQPGALEGGSAATAVVEILRRSECGLSFILLYGTCRNYNFLSVKLSAFPSRFRMPNLMRYPLTDVERVPRVFIQGHEGTSTHRDANCKDSNRATARRNAVLDAVEGFWHLGPSLAFRTVKRQGRAFYDCLADASLNRVRPRGGPATLDSATPPHHEDGL